MRSGSVSMAYLNRRMTVEAATHTAALLREFGQSVYSAKVREFAPALPTRSVNIAMTATRFCINSTLQRYGGTLREQDAYVIDHSAPEVSGYDLVWKRSNARLEFFL